MLGFSNGRLVDATLKLLELLSREVVAYSHPVTKDSFGHLLSETLSNLMKVMMNLTHDSNDECKLDQFIIFKIEILFEFFKIIIWKCYHRSIYSNYIMFVV